MTTGKQLSTFQKITVPSPPRSNTPNTREKKRDETRRRRPLLGMLDSEDEGITILRNVGNCLQIDTV
jgi:hypothetical protein